MSKGYTSFITNSARHYFEPFLIRFLAGGCPVDLHWVGSLNHERQRRMHYSKNKSELNKKFEQIINEKERQ